MFSVVALPHKTSNVENKQYNQSINQSIKSLLSKVTKPRFGLNLLLSPIVYKKCQNF